MKKFIKVYLLQFIPGKIKNFITWKKDFFKLLLNPWLRLRGEKELFFAESFVNYWQKLSAEEKNQKIIRLNKAGDNKITDFIITIMQRQEYLMKHEVLEQKKLFTKEELEEEDEYFKIIKHLKKQLIKYKISYLSPEAFLNISGLKVLPENEKAKLNNGIFIDAGAFNGDTAIALGLFFKPKMIYAFEPEKNNFEDLSYNASICKEAKIIPVKNGLGEKQEIASIKKDGPSSNLEKQNENNENIDITTIDDFLSNTNNNEKINLIKTDVEGWESSLLRGAEKTIARWRPILAISIYHSPEDFFEIKPWLEQKFPEHNYNFIITKANPFSLTQEIMLIAF